MIIHTATGNNYYTLGRSNGMIHRPYVNQNRLLKRYILLYIVVCLSPLGIVLIINQQHLGQNTRYMPIKILQEYKYNNYTKNINYNEISKIMKERRKLLQEKCHKYKLNVIKNDSDLHRPNTWEFLINYKHGLIWCNVFKAASTSWMFNFNILAGYKESFLRRTSTVPLALARKKYPRPTWEELKMALNNSISFFIVRHPLERLLSAYRDKIEFSLPGTYHQKLGRQIIARFRKKKLNVKKSTPTFEEFVRYLTEVYNLKQPMDMHWTPITNFCTPCLIKFDIIAKMETLWEDQKYLLKMTSLENVIKPQWRNLFSQKTADLKEKYYKQLNVNQIFDLYEIYKYDFELFNYTLNGYIEHVQNGTSNHFENFTIKTNN